MAFEMSDATAPIEGTDNTVPTAPKPPRAPFFAVQNNRALRMLGLVVVLASVLMSSISFLILSGTTNIEPSAEVWTIIWIVTGVLVLLVIALVVTEAMLLIQARVQNQAGAGLQIRMVTMFALRGGRAGGHRGRGGDHRAQPGPGPVVLRAHPRHGGKLAAGGALLHARARAGAARRYHLGGDRAGAGARHLRIGPRPLSAHPDRAGGDALAAVHLADFGRRRYADAGADQCAGRQPEAAAGHYPGRGRGGADGDRAGHHQSGGLGGQAARL